MMLRSKQAAALESLAPLLKICLAFGTTNAVPFVEIEAIVRHLGLTVPPRPIMV